MNDIYDILIYISCIVNALLSLRRIEYVNLVFILNSTVVNTCAHTIYVYYIFVKLIKKYTQTYIKAYNGRAIFH